MRKINNLKKQKSAEPRFKILGRFIIEIFDLSLFFTNNFTTNIPHTLPEGRFGVSSLA
jgi:hypothetical protein